MITDRTAESSEIAEIEWVTFPGGELEGQRPEAACAACRTRGAHMGEGAIGTASPQGSSRGPLCFQCYRAGMERARARAGLDREQPPRPSTRSSAPGEGAPHASAGDRWQWLLPFEPVNRARLEMLRAERATSRRSMQAGAGRFVDQRRRAQIAARHALQQITAGLQSRSLASAVHAAELQLPESWLPFVVSR